MLTRIAVHQAVHRALAEDAPWGDITVDALVDPGSTVTAVLRARESGVLAGIDVFSTTFTALNPAVAVTPVKHDGQRFDAGETLATVSGPTTAVLTGERVALNFAQRMSGVASLTRRFADAVAGLPVRIADTRKTTPGLRAFEKYAVRCGGGFNHRFGLSDAVMIKDNHLAACGAVAGDALRDAVLRARAAVGHTTHIEVEVDRLDQIRPALAGRPDSILLDNFTVDDLRRGVAIIRHRAIVEASGNVTLPTVRRIAQTGVDVISVGALTHSYRSIDLGLDIDADDRRPVDRGA